MGKRVLAWVVLVAFSVFSWSCVYTWKKTPLQSIEQDKRVRISAVQTKSGEKIDFPKNPAAEIQRDAVVGGKFFQDIAIEKSKIEKPKNLSGLITPFNLTTVDGKSYRVTRWTDINSKVILQAYVPFSIPLSDIDFVWIRKQNVPLTILVCLAPVAIFLAILVSTAGQGERIDSLFW